MKDVLKPQKEGTPEEKAKPSGAIQDLSKALDAALSENISKLNPKLASGVDLSDQIELIVATQLEENKEQKS